MANRNVDSDGNSKRQSKPSTKGKFNDAKFISCSLTAEQAAACKAWDYSGEQAWVDLDAIEETYRVTFKYDSYGRCSGCWIQPIDPEHEDAGYILCGRGNHPFKAFKQALYVWRVVGNGETWKQFDSNRGYDLDD